MRFRFDLDSIFHSHRRGFREAVNRKKREEFHENVKSTTILKIIVTWALPTSPRARSRAVFM